MAPIKTEFANADSTSIQQVLPTWQHQWQRADNALDYLQINLNEAQKKHIHYRSQMIPITLLKYR